MAGAIGNVGGSVGSAIMFPSSLETDHPSLNLNYRLHYAGTASQTRLLACSQWLLRGMQKKETPQAQATISTSPVAGANTTAVLIHKSTKILPEIKRNGKTEFVLGQVIHHRIDTRVRPPVALLQCATLQTLLNYMDK